MAPFFSRLLTTLVASSLCVTYSSWIKMKNVIIITNHESIACKRMDLCIGGKPSTQSSKDALLVGTRTADDNSATRNLARAEPPATESGVPVPPKIDDSTLELLARMSTTPTARKAVPKDVYVIESDNPLRAREKLSHNVPIVVISSLRPTYLAQALRAIKAQHQNPNTPDWMLHGKRYVFAHKNPHTDHDDSFNHTQAAANAFGYQLHVFDGIDVGPYPPSKPIRSYYTKQTWYRMMRHLFHTINETEALILEEDALLAHDGLLVASALLEEKWKRSDVHSIALGGHAGQNKIQPNPDTFLAVRPKHFQAMAYSLDATVFDQIDQAFLKAQAELQEASQTFLDQNENKLVSADWTMEITHKQLLPDLIQLEPSVGRMRHIGRHGMGYNGNGEKHRSFSTPWESWNAQVSDDSRDLSKFYLFPTDVRGFHGHRLGASQQEMEQETPMPIVMTKIPLFKKKSEV